MIEQPLYVKLMTMLWIRMKMNSGGIPDALQYDPEGVVSNNF